MNKKKTRRVLAVIALVFMAVFSVTLVIVFVSPTLLNGAFGYMALISGLLGIGIFLLLRYVIKDDTAPDCENKSDVATGDENLKTENQSVSTENHDADTK